MKTSVGKTQEYLEHEIRRLRARQKEKPTIPECHWWRRKRQRAELALRTVNEVSQAQKRNEVDLEIENAKARRDALKREVNILKREKEQIREDIDTMQEGLPTLKTVVEVLEAYHRRV